VKSTANLILKNSKTAVKLSKTIRLPKLKSSIVKLGKQLILIKYKLYNPEKYSFGNFLAQKRLVMALIY
jgi:hypothetical protein